MKTKQAHTKEVQVGIGNLRVFITRDDGSWFAQALEIDYASEGSTLAKVKKNFEYGLAATIHEHLKAFGNLEKLVQPAPQESWLELFRAAKMKGLYSQLSVHAFESLPFQQIQYFEQSKAA